MSETVFVTGATGLTGANVCKLLIERGDSVRALARDGADVDPLAALGVEIVTGDITDAGDVLRAAAGTDAAIHCAALLGGASQDLDAFRAHADEIYAASDYAKAWNADVLKQVQALT